MIDDDGKLRQRLANKRVNASKEGIECNLSLDDVITLLSEAGLTSSDWSIVGGYDLARYGDEGPYEYGNCRFITHQENISERKYVESSDLQNESRKASIIIARSYLNHDILSEAGRKGASGVNIERRERGIQNRKQIVETVLTSDIDVMKYGWKAKAAKLCGVSSTEIRRAFELYYEGETYSR